MECIHKKKQILETRRFSGIQCSKKLEGAEADEGAVLYKLLAWFAKAFSIDSIRCSQEKGKLKIKLCTFLP
jgi:hypothetical protein